MANLAPGTVCKILNRQEVNPHKVRYYQAAKRTDVPKGVSRRLERRDAAFDEKMAEVLCVYREVAVLRETNAETGSVAIISYDEKPGIQPIGNTASDLPPVPGIHPALAQYGSVNRRGGRPNPRVMAGTSPAMTHRENRRYKS